MITAPVINLLCGTPTHEHVRHRLAHPRETVITPDPKTFRDPVVAKVPKMFEAKWGPGTYDKIQAVR